VYYFAYASNLSKKQMQERCPGSQPKFMATLPNYKVVFARWSRKWRGGVASIQSSRGEKVRGAIYELDETCLRHLDKYEAGYERLNVIVFNEDNQAVPAVTYYMSGRLEEAPPSKGYLAVIRQGYEDWGIE
jgi:gamma-glutamylcyclotransferase (GGCT)/AIG2-like uncharacterized protein YtfP